MYGAHHIHTHQQARGSRIVGRAPVAAAFFDPEKALIALQRGAAMNVDLTEGWDYWPVMGEQVEALRRKYNILPAETFGPAQQPTVAT